MVTPKQNLANTIVAIYRVRITGGRRGKMIGSSPVGRPWTLTDDDQLRKLLVSGMKVTVIAQKMKRTIGAIQARKSFLKVEAK
jgi:hypothetical protein